ncbi:MAG: pantoate--beta-alanine ligase [Kiritimatiellia bacterium]|nr:pantoate--beta-alanine ligase [Lentisphaerota bacterium]
MQTVESITSLQAALNEWRDRKTRIGLVPTMGCLHDGHLSLASLARQRSDRVVLSIFVNPAQFGPGEDFQRYPRDLERDCRMCEKAGVDLVWHPAPAQIYAGDHSVYLQEDSLGRHLCGSARPGHFRGVLTIVAKLFNLIQPAVAVFGQKDAQQERLIRRMVRDLNFPVELITAPIMREADGLAMSSRNAYLDPQQRRDALCLSRALRRARRLYRAGERDVEVVRAILRRELTDNATAQIDYVEIVDNTTLQPVSRMMQPVLVALAVRFGATRLIDNLMLPDDRLSNLPE